MKTCQVQLVRASKLTVGLADEEVRWQRDSTSLGEQIQVWACGRYEVRDTMLNQGLKPHRLWQSSVMGFHPKNINSAIYFLLLSKTQYGKTIDC